MRPYTPDTYSIRPRADRKAARTWWRRHLDDILIGCGCLWYIAVFVLCLRRALTGGEPYAELLALIAPLCVYGLVVLIVANAREDRNGRDV